ncbi:hypothetical protein B5M09_008040 [Aphanomyces astaci]|uniref:RING-type domain-containing protein n=1 Tax=Aphanomyces astaci TaxID=112090 RepID=A0A425DHN2_APHAT|nr:hypothetical protein B5M09_008040 [Aphanomyces astaci]
MSMEHLQQFLRQQDQITQVAMDTLHVPFDLKSVRYAAAGAGILHLHTSCSCSLPSTGTDDTKSLSIAIESTVPSCSVQILWDLDIATAISTLSQPRGFVSTSKRRMYFPRSMSAFWSNFWSKWTQSVATDGGDQQPLQDTSGSSSSPPSTSTNMLHHPSSSLLDLDNGELRRLLPCQLRTDPYCTSAFRHDIYGADEFVECSICLEDPTTAIVLPCRHKCICATCLAEIDACPICRAKFASYITS